MIPEKLLEIMKQDGVVGNVKLCLMHVTCRNEQSSVR